MTNGSDVALPKALTDFVFDLYDSVTISQLTEEQAKLYTNDFRDLSNKYFEKQAWPSPQSIASECNGDPLFLAIYRELTHRHWHAVTRLSIRDRIEGWQVYRELFDEILDSDANNFFLIPLWVFDILNEFVYQFQGFCQVRTAVYASARKYGVLTADGTIQGNAQQTNLLENLRLLQSTTDAWDIEAIFSYLNRLSLLANNPSASALPVQSYLGLFASVSLSRLECLLGDYTACLQALTPLCDNANTVIEKQGEEELYTVNEVLQSVLPARLSVAYHAGVAYLMLRRYKDALRTLGDICAHLQRGFRTGQLRKLPGSDQFNKQFDRMIALLAIVNHICPSQGLLEDSVMRAIREKHGSRLESASSLEEWFQSPKFISVDPRHAVYRQQVNVFLKEIEPQVSARKIRSYLKLYTSIPVGKLATFHDVTEEDFIAQLLSYKLRMRQLEQTEKSYLKGAHKMALDIHYYLDRETVHVDEAEKSRRLENYFVSQIAGTLEVLRDVELIDISV